MWRQRRHLCRLVPAKSHSSSLSLNGKCATECAASTMVVMPRCRQPAEPLYRKQRPVMLVTWQMCSTLSACIAASSVR